GDCFGMRVELVVEVTAATEVYTLSLHDALPICPGAGYGPAAVRGGGRHRPGHRGGGRRRSGRCPGAHRGHPHRGGGGGPGGSRGDRKSTRLNSSHVKISYAVFCLKKKTNPNPSW